MDFLAQQEQYAPATQNNEGTMSNRAGKEVEAAMVIAKKFPRDETEAFKRIMESCQRPSLAEGAMYQYPRGGQKVSGPSIRLAEAMAQNWGNLDFGIIELEQRFGESTMMAYCWDLQTNTRQSKIFTVKHERKARGEITKLNDPRDIYELTANQGARRLRACILGVIPGDIVDKAVETCEKTLTNGSKEPLKDRIRSMITAFDRDFSVTKEMIEGRLGYSVDAMNERDLLSMRSIYASLRDNMSAREDWFTVGEKQPDKKVESKFEKPVKQSEPEKKAEAPVAPPVEKVVEPVGEATDVKAETVANSDNTSNTGQYPKQEEQILF